MRKKIVCYRLPCKVQQQVASRSRKSSSKCLEAVFETTETAAAKTEQVTAQKSKDSEVLIKQMNSTPIDHNADELHGPPVSLLFAD